MRHGAVCALLLGFVLLMVRLAPAQTTERVSVSTAGVGGDNWSGNEDRQAVSSDGRLVVFSSWAENLGPGNKTGKRQLYLRDRTAGTTTLVSVATGTVTLNGDGHSFEPVITPDGHFVAFASAASNLVPNDNNNTNDVFVRDLLAGTTERVSVTSAETQAGLHSSQPSISADGRIVAFMSMATDLVPNHFNNVRDIYVRDRVAGTTILVSVALDGTNNGGNGDSINPAISDDGRFVAFVSYASNLVAGDTNMSTDIFVRDLAQNTTTRVNVGPGNLQTNWAWNPAISGNGRYVAFASESTGLVQGDFNSLRDVFVHDLQAQVTERVSVAKLGGGDALGGNSDFPSLSFDGRYVAFASAATNLVGSGTDDSNYAWDCFVRDRELKTTARVSVTSTGGWPNGPSYNTVAGPAISSSGSWVAFPSNAGNMVPGSLNGRWDVYVRGPGFGRAAIDVDGDGRSDSVVWRSTSGTWYARESGTNGTTYTTRQWGSAELGDVPLPGDFDGDRRTDLGLWRASTGTWYVLKSTETFAYANSIVRQWGSLALGDVPVPADYDGDGKTDLAVWRASTGTWYWLRLSDGYTTYRSVQWGSAGLGDVPVPADYDGDRIADLAVWRASTGTWFILKSTDNYGYASYLSRQWGSQALGDQVLPADYDGDGRADLGLWRPGTGTWYCLLSSSGYASYTVKQWGTQGDRAAPADYDGDGKTDLAVWRPTTGTWYALKSDASNTFSSWQWGSQGAGDQVVREK